MVVVKPRRKDFLIIALNQRMLFDEQIPQTNAADGFAIGKMMNNLGGAPLSGNRMVNKPFLRKAIKTFRYLVVAIFVPRD